MKELLDVTEIEAATTCLQGESPFHTSALVNCKCQRWVFGAHECRMSAK
jgi:hypothetical protein